MARRRSTNAKRTTSKPRGVDPKESKIKRWETVSDIPLDEEDQFHASRDRILLEDEESGGDEDGDEDEVFALKGVSDHSEDDEEDEEEGGRDEGDNVEEDSEDEDDSTPKSSKKTKGKKGKKALSPSSSDEESESEQEGWGRKKSAYYSSNAAELESDDEEELELEEQEAKRLQAKARDAMVDDDFGIGDPVEIAPDPEDVLVEAPAPVVQPLPQDKYSLLKHLEKTNPEALALARDWEDVAYKLAAAQVKLAKIEAEPADAVHLGMTHLYYQALLTYATTLAFYLHLRASEKYAQRPDSLRSHPILQRLLTLRQALSTLEDLDFGLSDTEDDTLDDSDMMEDMDSVWTFDKKKGLDLLDLGELQSLLKEANEAISSPTSSEFPNPKKSKQATSKSKSDASSDDRPKKKRKTNAPSKPAIPTFDLVEPDLSHFTASSSSATSRQRTEVPITEVFGDATHLQAADAVDKQARRKSLRFYTARIENTSARRQNARARAIGGDDDIPYRERKKQKEERLEAAKNRGQGGDDLDDTEPEPRGSGEGGDGKKDKQKRKRRREQDDDDESGSGAEEAEGYYELVARQSKEDKERKKQVYDAIKVATKSLAAEESAEGPRGLTHAMLKNKGLTPHRSKSVRNPRVKKREKYEKAKRKVASQRAVYKGGQDTTKYGGEKTGISRVVKSVRL